MDLQPLLEAKVSPIKVNEYSRFPSISRDLALVVDRSVTSMDLIKTIKYVGRGTVVDAYVFDVYENINIINKKSIAISIIYQKNDSTLTDEDVNEVENKIKLELNKAYKAEIRN